MDKTVSKSCGVLSPHHGSLVHVTQPGPCTAIAVPSLSSESSSIICPHCRALIYTATEAELSATGYLSLVSWFCSSCCIPYFMNSCINVKHTCPKCCGYLGEFKSRKEYE